MTSCSADLWRRKKESGIAVKAISVDDEPTYLEAWRKDYGLTFPIEWDRDHHLALRYRIWTSDCVYVVDRAGIVRFVHAGFHDQEEKQIEAEVDSLL